MGKLLLIVEDSFQVSGLGATVVPFVSPEILGTGKAVDKQQVRLVRPDGTEELVEAAIRWTHFNPGGYRFCLYLYDGKKEQVPPGTEIWLL
jgi:hypothetical protein